jgi:hypothetical protein
LIYFDFLFLLFLLLCHFFIECTGRVACASKGSFQYVPGGVDLPVVLGPYFDYLIKTSTPEMGEVFWSDPYIDAFGLGLMVTIASPVIVSFVCEKKAKQLLESTIITAGGR